MSRDPKYIWFPAKTYGWGWGLPCRWQGWVVMAVYLVLVVGGAFFLRAVRNGPVFIAYMTVLTAVLVVICWRKGETPRWRWGKD